MFCCFEKNFKTHSLIFFRPYVQVQAEARKAEKAENVMKNTSKSKAAKQGFSYLDASQQTPAQTSTTPWGSKLDQNVPGAQMNAEDFTKQFMQDMYDGSAQAAGAGAAGAGVQATSLTSTQAATLAVAQQEQQLKQQQTVSHLITISKFSYLLLLTYAWLITYFG